MGGSTDPAGYVARVSFRSPSTEDPMDPDPDWEMVSVGTYYVGLTDQEDARRAIEDVLPGPASRFEIQLEARFTSRGVVQVESNPVFDSSWIGDSLYRS